jgi:hypothetical protein
MLYRHLMTTPSHEARPTVIGAGRPSWRVAAAAEADRLDAQLNVARESAEARLHESPAAVSAIRRAIEQAREVATGKTGWKTLADWWFGTSIESSWQALHRAAEQLVMVLPAAPLRAMVPHLKSLATATFGAERATEATKTLDAWDTEPPTPPDPLVAQQILSAYDVQSDIHHQQIRGLRNLLYIFFAAALAIDCALWATGVTAGAVVGLGALAGTVSVAFAIRTGTPSGPYNLLPAQSVLKIATGAATAIMAAKILDFASNVPATTARDSVYAIVFGFSQQAFTRLVDQRADALSKGPDARSGHGTALGPVRVT